MKIVRKSQNALWMAQNLGLSSFLGPAEPPLAVRVALSTWLGFGLVALTNGLWIAARLPLPLPLQMEGRLLRLQHHVFDAAGILGVGLASALVVAVATFLLQWRSSSVQSKRARALLGLLAYSSVSTAIALQLIGHELHRVSLMLFHGNHERPLFLFSAASIGALVPLLHFIAWRGALRPRIRWGLLLLGLTTLSVNHVVLRDDYAGAHGLVAWLGATVSGPPALALLGPRLFACSQRARQLLLSALLSISALGLALRPSVLTRLELFREPSAISAWIFAQCLWPIPGSSPDRVPESLAQHPFWQSRKGLPSIGPTTTYLPADRAPVVVMLTIDAFRADVLENEQWAPRFPTFSRLKEQGVYFPRAVAPGSQTAVSLSTLFSSKYFSQLVWQDYGKGSTRFAYPANDTSLRFPEVLSRASIKTATYCSITFLSNEYGVARGFAEQTVVTKGREHATIEDVMGPLFKRLLEAREEPLFLYAHITEPHAPYDRGGTKGSTFERYLNEIAVVDGHLDKLLDFMKQRFPTRGYLIVTSDHGEAFGEHSTYKHTKTLYEELVRVPLFFYGPGLKPGLVREPVGLIDLGPTIVDLFRLPIPSEWMGESLLPLLVGEEKHLQRPLIAEGRLRRALYWKGLKVIDDPRRKVVEVFDLERDPKELENLYEKAPAQAEDALLALRSFFLVHRAHAQAYEPPYRP